MSRTIAALCLLFACSPPPTVIEPDAGGEGGGAAGGGAGGGAAGGQAGGAPVHRIVSLAITPAQLSLKVGAVSGFTCMATFDDSTTADVSSTV